MNLAAAIAGVFAIDPDAPALEFEARWRSWALLAQQAADLGRLLNGKGVGSGKRVGVLLRNHADLVPVLLALFSTDRCLASLNAVSPDNKLAEDIENAQAPVLVALATDRDRPLLKEAAARSGAICIGVTEAGAAVLKEGVSALWRKPDAPDIAIEMLSSGTTGAPKRIPLPRRNFEKALAGAASFERGRDEGALPKLRSGVQIVTAPLAHIAGITGLMNNLLAGRKVCLIERFTVEAFRDAVVRHRPKVAGAPPSALRMILDADVPREDFASLVAYRTGTAPLDPDLADAFYEKYGIPVLQNYGATEFAGGVAG